MKSPLPFWFAASTLTALAPLATSARPAENVDSPVAPPPTFYRTVKVDDLDIFYREAGPQDAPVVLLLHGFPTSSRMFRNLIPVLADHYHVIAPDYPGFGHSSAPSADQFSYTFDHLAQIMDNFVTQLGLTKYSLYVQDYGAPIGYRLASQHPERVQALIVQNGNAYAEGLDNDFWKPIKAYWANKTPETAAPVREALRLDAIKWQYTNGVRQLEKIDPDTWTFDQALIDRPGQEAIQMALFYSYSSNPPLYSHWQEYFRKYQPPTLIVWGKNDAIFPAAGATPYLRDLPKAELHLLDTGHFALEEDGDVIAGFIRAFLAKHVSNVR
jgi:pimeloyl-ACP methyl ester carboxylesterase